MSAGRGSDVEKLDVSTTVVTREQIDAMPETSVDQIVNRIPGVWTFTIPTGQLHPTNQPFNIRGFGSSTTIATLVLVDGVPLNDPYFRTIDWSSVSKSSIDRIEVIRGGGATSLWGNMAMGGVVNIVTKQPTKTGAALDANYGSYNTTSTGVEGSWVFDKRLSAGLNYSHASSSGYNLTPGAYQNPNLVPTSSKVDNVNVTLNAAPSEALSLFAKAYYHQAYEDGLVWALSHNQWSSYRVLLGGSYRFTDKTALNFSGWAGGGVFSTINTSSGSYSLNNINALNQYINQRETAPNNNQGATVFLQTEAGRLQDIKIGGDMRRTQVTDNIDLFSATGAQTSFVAQGEHRLQGVFAQGTYRFEGIPLDVTVGLRGDFYQAVNASVLNVNTGTLTPVADSSAANFDPRLGLKFYVNDAITLRGAVYRNFTEPGMNQMYRSFASGTGYTAINPALQPMTNVGEEVGFDVKWREFTLSATVFNNNLDNFIDFVAICTANAACAAPYAAAAGLTGITSVNQYNNVGSAVFKGYEIIGTWQPIQQVLLSAGFTATSAYLTSTNYPALARTGVQLGQTPPWMFNAGAQVRPIENLALSVNLKSFPAYWNNTGHTQLNDGATLVDIGATYSFNKSVDLYGAVQNLFNAQYLAQGYTMTSFEGSTINATSIPALGQPLTASVGLRARF
ncbi:MAG: TonB-dependent receptor [Proteobacteria bacterium]|nr:TonB-dependent receptor [Pseudomonadota bacterium]